MTRIRLLHWNAVEAAERGARLQALGYDVEWALPAGPQLMREARTAPPDLYVIDLSRIPSQGRDVALSLRATAAARSVPIVFVGGDPAKTERTRELLPDAVFATWDDIAAAVALALSRPVPPPDRKLSSFDGYAGRPLTAKLGMKAGTVASLIDAPEGFAAALGELPPGTRLHDGFSPDAALIVWFVRSQQALSAGIAGMAAQIGERPLWIAWPKKASGVAADVTQPLVRAAGLSHGLVDYKIASFDDTWSGLLFRRRKER